MKPAMASAVLLSCAAIFRLKSGDARAGSSPSNFHRAGGGEVFRS